jgi:hypothetical protein
MNSSSSKGGAGGGGTRRRPHARARGLRRWLARAQGLEQGLTVPELVHELHVRRGLPLPEVAQVLGMSLEEVRKHRPQRGAAAEVRAPESEADFTGLRERIGVALWETVMATYSEGNPGAENAEEGVPAPVPKAAMLPVRIRALKQIGKLYGGGRKKRGGDDVPREYATPEEIVEAVREWRERRGVDGG